MAKADSVLSTPPTNTSALDQPMMFPPRDPTRRRFLAVAAVASVVSTGTLAAATAMDQSVLQAVTVPQASRALRDAIRALDSSLIAAQADNEEVEAIWMDWQRSHPQPRSNRAPRKWIKKGAAYHQRVTAPSRQALMRAEPVFATAQSVGIVLRGIQTLAIHRCALVADSHAIGITARRHPVVVSSQPNWLAPQRAVRPARRASPRVCLRVGLRCFPCLPMRSPRRRCLE
jgi:hypothetical protein